MNTKLLDCLNEQQVTVVKSLSGPRLILAGAGSGKTRTLTYKIAYLIEQKKYCGEEIMAVTFTRKSAQEMQENLSSLLKEANDPPSVTTLHSFAAQVLRDYQVELGLAQNFVIYDADQALDLIKKITKNQTGFDPVNFARKIAFAKKNLLLPGDLTDQADFDFIDLYQSYQNELLDKDALDYNDLLLYIYILWQSDKKILEKYQDKYKIILVDEFQDLSLAQYRIISLLASKHRNLCVAGDPDQAIYSSRGANYFTYLNQDFPELRTFILEENYRSSQNILKVSHSLINQNLDRIDKTLCTKAPEGSKVVVAKFVNDISESHFIVKEISKLMGGINFTDFDNKMIDQISSDGNRQLRDFAVLYRTPDVGEVLASVLSKTGIPFQMIGQIYIREVQELIAYLRCLYNSNDDLSLLKIINIPSRNIGAQTIRVLEDLAQEKECSLFKILNDIDLLPFPPTKKESLANFMHYLRRWRYFCHNVSPDIILKKIIQDIDFHKLYSSDSQANKNILEFLTFASQFAEYKGIKGITMLLDEYETLSPTDYIDNDADKITLISVPDTKGLEYKIVFMIGMEEGIFPYKTAKDQADIEDERRLCYVAMTRAKEKLYLLHSEKRKITKEELLPSQFLRKLPEGRLEHKIYLDDISQSNTLNKDQLRLNI